MHACNTVILRQTCIQHHDSVSIRHACVHSHIEGYPRLKM